MLDVFVEIASRHFECASMTQNRSLRTRSSVRIDEFSQHDVTAQRMRTGNVRVRALSHVIVEIACLPTPRARARARRSESFRRRWRRRIARFRLRADVRVHAAHVEILDEAANGEISYEFAFRERATIHRAIGVSREPLDDARFAERVPVATRDGVA